MQTSKTDTMGNHPDTLEALTAVIDSLAAHDADVQSGTNYCDRRKLGCQLDRLSALVADGFPIPSLRRVLDMYYFKSRRERRPKMQTRKSADVQLWKRRIIASVIFATKCETVATKFVLSPDDADTLAAELSTAAEHARTFET